MLNKSEQINELATALAKAQGAMEAASKDTANPFFKSKYADLASIMEAVRKPFADNGLSYVQSPSYDKSTGEVTVDMILMHSSGQFIVGAVSLPVSKADAQGVGSAITYGRRYILAAMCGVVADDDDGNAAVGNGQQKTVASKPAGTATTPVNKAQPTDGVVLNNWKGLFEKLNNDDLTLAQSMKEKGSKFGEVALKFGVPVIQP